MRGTRGCDVSVADRGVSVAGSLVRFVGGSRSSINDCCPVVCDNGLRGIVSPCKYWYANSSAAVHGRILSVATQTGTPSHITHAVDGVLVGSFGSGSNPTILHPTDHCTPLVLSSPGRGLRQ